MSLAELTCGLSSQSTSYGEILAHLSATIQALDSELLGTLHSPEERKLSIVGPYLARSLIETAFTALTARMDPFRILVVGAYQREEAFEPSKQTKCAFRWQGDVMDPAPKRDADQIGDLEPTKYSRALLGDPWDRLMWRQAHQRLIDQYTEAGLVLHSEWHNDVVNAAPEELIPQRRLTARRLYSLFSKGVHSEFVIPISAYYDPATMVDAVDETYKLLAQLSLLLNYVDHIPGALNQRDAQRRLVDIEERVRNATS